MNDLSKIDLSDLFHLKSDLLIAADLVRNKSVKVRLVEHAELISRLIAERVSDNPGTQLPCEVLSMTEQELQQAYTRHCEMTGQTKMTRTGFEDFKAGFRLGQPAAHGYE